MYRYPPPSLLSDLEWWRQILTIPAIFRNIVKRGPPVDLYYYVDASTSYGIGVIFGTNWIGWKLAKGWATKFRHILWLEASRPGDTCLPH